MFIERKEHDKYMEKQSKYLNIKVRYECRKWGLFPSLALAQQQELQTAPSAKS